MSQDGDDEPQTVLDECDECDKENADLNCCVDTMTAVTKHRDPATIAFDELKTKNEQLVLENLNYRYCEHAIDALKFCTPQVRSDGSFPDATRHGCMQLSCASHAVGKTCEAVWKGTCVSSPEFCTRLY